MDSLFLGQARARRQINLGGSSQTQQHGDLVQQAKLERLQRQQDRARSKAARTIQVRASLVRGAIPSRDDDDTPSRNSTPRVAPLAAILTRVCTQAFYRGRQSAAQSRNHFQAEYDRLIAVRNNQPSLQDFVTASRLVALGGQYRVGNPHDIKRLAAWCRVALQPPQDDAAGENKTPPRGRRPTPLLFAPFATSASWPVLTCTIARLLLTEATTNVS